MRPNAKIGGGAGAEVDPTSLEQGGSLALLRMDAVVPTTARVFLLKIDVQGHETQALRGVEKLFDARSVHLISLEWWPMGIQAQGVADGGIAGLRALYDRGAVCYDLQTHGYNVPTRPSELSAWTQYLLDVPLSADELGGWEDLLCTMAL